MANDMYTANNTKIDLTQDEETIARLLWEEGFRSVYDYNQFIQQAPIQHIGHQISHDLMRANLVTCGFSLDYDDYNQDLLPTAIDYHTLVQKNQTLVKMIADWRGFMQQISDYRQRPALRVAKPTQATHKLDLRTNQIIPYQHKRRQKTVFTHTKKQSTSALSKHLHTRLFTDGVGLLFDENKCDVRAMFRQNAATVGREWVGSYWSVRSYQNNVGSNLMTDRQAFRDHVDQAPGLFSVNNEVLAKLSRESILGVFISGDSSTNRTEARQRQQELKAKLNIDCPIFIYDAAAKSLRIYTLRDQQNDTNQNKVDFATENNKLLVPLVAAINAGDATTLQDILTKTPRLIRRLDQDKLLIAAAKKAYSPVIDTLLNHGCKVDQEDKNKQTALIMASRYGDVGIVTRLIASGASLDHSDCNHETAVMHAVRYNNKDVVQVLLDSKADLTLENNKGRTVFDIAIQNNNMDMLQTLLLHAAGIEDDEELLNTRSAAQIKSIFTRLMDDDHVDAVMAFLLLEVANLMHSFQPTNPLHAQAIVAATTLHASLKDAFDIYRKAGSQPDDRDELYETWNNAFDTAKKSELANHRHWAKNVFTHLSLFLLTVGVGYLAVGMATLYQTSGQRFFFQTNTRSTNKLLELESLRHALLV